MDKARLIKILNLTTSANDNEALAAIRMANKIIKAGGKTWDNLIAVQLQNAGLEAWAHQFEDDEDEDIETMLSNLLDRMPTNEFLLSISDWFNKKGTLTPKQEEALKRIYHDHFW